jgi:hypothetical protein
LQSSGQIGEHFAKRKTNDERTDIHPKCKKEKTKNEQKKTDFKNEMMEKEKKKSPVRRTWGNLHGKMQMQNKEMQECEKG